MKLLFKHKFFAAVLFTGLLSVVGGCSKEEKVGSYAVDKPAVVHEQNHVDAQSTNAPTAPMVQRPGGATTSEPARMFAAIVPQGDNLWFFKMTGPVETVASLAKPLADFIGTVKYEGDEATWSLPEGWEQKPGNQFRFATLIVPSDAGSQEFTVSRLGGGPDEVQLVTANINRWRGQLGLDAIKAEDVNKAGEDISESLSKKKNGESTTYFVNIVRKQSEVSAAAPKMQPPAASASTASKPARMFAAIVPQGADVWYYKVTGPVEAVAAAVKPMSDFIATVKYEGDKATWTLPAGWKETAGNSFRFATLIVPGDAGPLEFAVSRFKNGPDEVIHALANINRWRGQLGLDAIKAEEVNKAGEDITQATSKQKIGEQTIYYVNIVGKQAASSGRPPFAR